MTDEELQQAKVEYYASSRLKAQRYVRAVKFHKDMASGRRKQSDKNLNLHDVAIRIIRDFRRYLCIQ